jgi:sec-independent protein translocase protein TatA
MFGLGMQELLVVLVIAFFIFGGKKLPEIGAGLGKGLRSFKDGLKDLEEEADPRKILNDVPGVREVRDIKKEVEGS